MTAAPNVHGTAIVIGTTGLLFLGPSGTGKSAVALHCIGQARAQGVFAALVSDDQVLLGDAGGRLHHLGIGIERRVEPRRLLTGRCGRDGRRTGTCCGRVVGTG